MIAKNCGRGSGACRRSQPVAQRHPISQGGGGRVAVSLPLAGLRVLDVSQVMAGPFCSMLLGDMGADVIKIEPPDGGDQSRRAMGFKLKGDDSLGFINMNRNKRSVVLNLKSEAGRKVFYRSSTAPISWSRTIGPGSPRASASTMRRCGRSIRVSSMRASPDSARPDRGRSGPAST